MKDGILWIKYRLSSPMLENLKFFNVLADVPLSGMVVF